MPNELIRPVPSFDQRHYVPCVRWKMGEYQAVSRLSPKARGVITPFIEVPERGFDFETGQEAKTLEAHIKLFPERIAKKWGRGVCFVDPKLLNEGMSHAAHFIFSGLQQLGCAAVPVTGIERSLDYQKAVRRASTADKRGICLRVSLLQASGANAKREIDRLLASLGTTPEGTDCVLDMEAPGSFEPIDGFVGALLAIVERLPYLRRWRTLTLMGTSFPETTASLQRGPQLVPRHEWMAYKELVDRLRQAKLRLPTFGDYCIAHPKVLDIDPRIMKPPATVRYTTDGAWYVVKGTNVRKDGFAQYRGLCSDVASSRHFTRGLSKADMYIAQCALGEGATGNLTTWRWVGTNHHIEKVVFDIASLFGS